MTGSKKQHYCFHPLQINKRSKIAFEPFPYILFKVTKTVQFGHIIRISILDLFMLYIWWSLNLRHYSITLQNEGRRKVMPKNIKERKMAVQIVTWRKWQQIKFLLRKWHQNWYALACWHTIKGRIWSLYSTIIKTIQGIMVVESILIT